MAEETYSAEGPQCPYCGRQFTADGPHYYSDDYEQDECDECGGKFAVTVHTTVAWSCEPIDAPEHPPQVRGPGA
jgi:tRNA(Ile2) C34 agmatinyltransferase TiaS